MTNEAQKALEQKALAYMDAHKEELYGLLSKLIQFDSQGWGETGRETECARFIEKLYGDEGLETDVYCPNSVPGLIESPLFWPGHNTDKRPNVTGIRWGADRGSRVTIMAHIDTVPAGDEDKWELSPFSGAIRGGRIYGRGSGDNKFGIAGGYWAVKVLDDLGVKLNKSVVLTSYCDEEFGGGNGALAACMKYPCETFVNLDGGGYEMWVTALGGGCFEIKVHKNDTTDNFESVYEVLEALMKELRVFGDRRRAELHENPFYTGSVMEAAGFRLSSLGNVGSGHQDGRLSFTIYTDKTKEEIWSELHEIEKKVRPVFEKNNISTEGFQATTRFFGYYETDRSHPALRTMQQAASETIGYDVPLRGSCLTDLSVIMPAGLTDSSFNFGILRDFSLEGGAHQPNEFVDCEQFLAHTKALILFLIRHCGVAE